MDINATSTLFSSGLTLAEEDELKEVTIDINDDRTIPEEEVNNPMTMTKNRRIIFEAINAHETNRWINTPIVTNLFLLARCGKPLDVEVDNISGGKSLAYPRLFFVDEESYKGWLHKDGQARFFHWTNKGRTIPKANGRSLFVWYETWRCHRYTRLKAVKPIIERPKRPRREKKILYHPLQGEVQPSDTEASASGSESEPDLDSVSDSDFDSDIEGDEPEQEPQEARTTIQEDNTIILPKKSRSYVKDYVGACCQARVQVYKLCNYNKDLDPTHNPDSRITGGRVLLAYYPCHSHHIGDANDVSLLQLSEAKREEITERVRIGLPRRDIRRDQSLPPDLLVAKAKSMAFTRDDLVTGVDVDNIQAKFWDKVTRLHKNDKRSMLRWIRQLEYLPEYDPNTPALNLNLGIPDGEKFFTFYHERTTAKGKILKAFGFAHPWQIMKFRSNPTSIGLDSTHKVTRYGFELFTIVIQDPETMRGIPVAFLLTSDKTSIPLQKWLADLQGLVGPIKFITTDDSNMERKAIKDAFDGRVTIHLCLWHIARAWSNKIRSIVKEATVEESKRVRRTVLNELKEIMYEPELLQARIRITMFLEKWAAKEELIAYIKKEYLQTQWRQELWMKAYRKDIYYAAMDTNNYVESWHNNLKTHFLRQHKRIRGDRLIYILTHVVIEHFKGDEAERTFRVGRRSTGEIMDIARYREVKSMTTDTIITQVLRIPTELPGNQFRYGFFSFTNPGLLYDIVVNDRNMIISCSCPYFLRIRRVCKHIFSIARVLSHLSMPEGAIFQYSTKHALPPVPIRILSPTLVPAPTPVPEIPEAELVDTVVDQDQQQVNKQEDLDLEAMALLDAIKSHARCAVTTPEYIAQLQQVLDTTQSLAVIVDTRKNGNRELQDNSRKRRR